jgi:hypothetical protein
MKSFKQHIGEKDMTAISSWKKKLKKVKGLTKQQIQMLSTLPTPVLTSLINQVGMIVSGNDVEESTKAYGDSLRKIARDRQLKNISKKDKQTLLKIADLLAKANEDVDEASLVMGDMDIVRSILEKIEDDFQKLSLKGKMEAGWPRLQMLAKMAGYGITKAKQAKNRTFRYDLKKR